LSVRLIWKEICIPEFFPFQFPNPSADKHLHEVMQVIQIDNDHQFAEDALKENNVSNFFKLLRINTSLKGYFHITRCAKQSARVTVFAALI